MKNILTYFCILLCWPLFYSCIDDDGNYTYLDKTTLSPVRIEGLCSDTTIMVGSQLKLSPKVKNADDKSRYTYNWYIMDNSANGFLPRQWELGNQIDLDWTANLSAATYRLNFRVYDNLLDIYTRHEIIVKIEATPINKGWYILKDDGNTTDMDYISIEEGEEGKQYNNVLATYNENIPGTAVSMCYQQGRYEHVMTNPDGTVTTLINLTAWHILTSEDIRTYDAKDFTLYKTFNNEFYDTPEICRPQTVTGNSSHYYLINNGKAHKLNCMSSNVGKFGGAAPGFYDLKSDIILYTLSSNAVFDKNTHSFLEFHCNNTELLPIEEAVNDQNSISLQNMDYDLVCAGSCSITNSSAILLKGINNDKALLLQLTNVYDADNYTFVQEWTNISQLSNDSKLRNAQHIAAVSNFFYFTDGENIYSYTNATDAASAQRERLWLSLPGEKITHMEYIYHEQGLAVLTSQNNTWKLRIYKMLGESTPDLNLEPAEIYEGTGNAPYFTYREY